MRSLSKGVIVVLAVAMAVGVIIYAEQRDAYLAATCRGGEYDEQANIDSIYELLKRKGKEVDKAKIELNVLGYARDETWYAFRVGDISGEAVGDKCGANEVIDLNL